MALRALPLTRPAPLGASPLAEDVLRGLGGSPKTLPPKLFYDDEGSQLFSRITQLPEYYLTRTERAIFRRHGAEMLAAAGHPHDFVELGAGTAEKTGVLLAEALRQGSAVTYSPIDVSGGALSVAARQLQRRLPSLRVRPLVADYTNGFSLPPAARGHGRLVLWIGSSMGNFEHREVMRILRNLRSQLANENDAVLLGADLAKPSAILLPAYDDAAGVTARFNKNVLARINRELGADFALDRFTHRAVWNPRASRMEMYLESRVAQSVRIPGLGVFGFAAGERIHTENSYKYRPAQLRRLLAAGGFRLERTFTDPEKLFAVLVARPV